ncbi:hypothetical protein ACFQH6_11225 [Halobacteriaceae archaeon GCM10025711]
MFGIESLSGNAYSAAMIGLVLAEAMVLYVGYGALERLVGPTLMDFLRGD